MRKRSKRYAQTRKEVYSVLRISLKAARVNANLTQGAAASALGVSLRTLCRWEKGQSHPTTEMIPAICEVYGISYDHINFFAN